MPATHNKTTFYLKRSIGLLLLLALAATFLFSAYSKIFQGFSLQNNFFSSTNNFFVEGFTIDNNAFDGFRWTFLDMGINSITTAGVLARLVIGTEFMIALFLLCHIFLKKFTYPLIIVLLSVFTLYLVYVLIRQGNAGSCGCFGNKLEMTPLAAIWKNVGMLAATLLLMYLYPVKPYKNQEWISVFIGMAAIVSPFVFAPLHDDIMPATVVNDPINLDPLYESSPAPQIDLRKGKHIVAFMSLTCHHCQKAAYLLHMVHHQNPDIPLFFVLSGHPDQQKDFFKETHAEAVPHMLFTNTNAFIKFAGKGVPAIYWINNSVIERTSTYYQLDPAEMKEWLKQ